MDLPFLLYDNRFADAAPTATDTADGFEVDHVTDWRAYLRWVAASVGTKYLTVDCGVAASADALGIAGHNLGSTGATVQVETSADGASWTPRTPALSPPADDGPLVWPFFMVSARYWRLKVVAGSAAPEIGVLCVGARTEFPEYPDAPLDLVSEGSEADIALSKGGHLLGVASKYCPYTFSLDFTYFPHDWVTEFFRPFWRDHGKHFKPFFVRVFERSRFCRLPENYRLSERLTDAEYLERFSVQFEGVAP